MIGPNFGKLYNNTLMTERKVIFFVIHKYQVPKIATVLPEVWQLKRKRDIKSGIIKKYKARLNVDGSRTKQGIHYDHYYEKITS